MLGRLSWAAIPFNVPVVMIAAGSVGFVIFCVLALVTVKGWWPYLWREWITSVDHKRIGVMYIILALLMLVRGFSDAMLMRSQLALAAGHAQGYLPPEHYDQIFSAHGTIMIFFVAMPFVVGLMNFVLPLQLGVRDVAFPVLNSVSFWLTAAGVLLVNVSLVVGEFARTGWLAYPPLSEIAYSPGVGVDYYLWSLQISGMGTLLSGINLTDYHPEVASAGHGLPPNADLLLDRARLESPYRRGFSDLDGDVCDAAARSLLRFSFLYQRAWRQSHDVRQSHLELGPSGGLYLDTARIRGVFGGGRYIFGQTAVRSALDGHGYDGDLRALLHRMAASFFHHGRGRKRECLLRHRDDDHRSADGCEDFQLAVHALWGPHPFHHARLLGARVHGDVHRRRHDGCPHGDPTGRLRSAQQSVSDRALS
jgi:hypothetical protein